MTLTEQRLLDRITLNPGVMVGKPVIRGMRLTVESILNLLARGATAEEIVQEYTGLVEEDIQACLLFTAESLGNIFSAPMELEIACSLGTGPPGRVTPSHGIGCFRAARRYACEYARMDRRGSAFRGDLARNSL